VETKNVKHANLFFIVNRSVVNISRSEVLYTDHVLHCSIEW